MTPAPLPIDELRRKAEAAFHGPWETGDGEGNGSLSSVYCDDDTGQRIADCDGRFATWTEAQMQANAAHIAAFCSSTALAILDRLAKAEAETKPPLWAVHVRGPDDVVPVPSYEHAVLLADQVNWWWATLPVTENDAIISAVPMLWDGSAEQHAVEVAKLGTRASDYRLPTPERVEQVREKAFAQRVALTRAQDAEKRLGEMEAALGAPVVWQYRLTDGMWCSTSEEKAKDLAAFYDHEIRPLFAARVRAQHGGGR